MSSTPVRSILRSVSKRDRFNILTFVNYPYYDHMIALTGHVFNAYNGNHLPSEWRGGIVPQPSNYMINITPDIPLNMDCDLILVHNKLHQFEIGKMFSRFWHLPVAMIHQLAPRDLKFRPEWRSIQERLGHTNIFFSEKIQEGWEKPGFIINPGVIIPDEIYPGKIYGAVGHIPCSKQEERMITNVIGEVEFIPSWNIQFVDIVANTTNAFYPIHVLEAMAAGKVVVTIDMPELENIIEDGRTGFIVKNVSDFKKVVAHLRANEHEMREVGKNAHEHVRVNFPLDKFVKKMNIALSETANIVYTR